MPPHRRPAPRLPPRKQWSRRAHNCHPGPDPGSSRGFPDRCHRWRAGATAGAGATAVPDPGFPARGRGQARAGVTKGEAGATGRTYRFRSLTVGMNLVPSSRFVPFRSVLPAAGLPWRRDPDSRVSRAPVPARPGARLRRRGLRAFRNGAFPVKHVFSTPHAAVRFPSRAAEGGLARPGCCEFEPPRRGLVIVVGSARTPVRRSPFSCPSPGSRFRSWSARWPPTSCLVQCGSRVPI